MRSFYFKCHFSPFPTLLWLFYFPALPPCYAPTMINMHVFVLCLTVQRNFKTLINTTYFFTFHHSHQQDFAKIIMPYSGVCAIHFIFLLPFLCLCLLWRFKMIYLIDDNKADESWTKISFKKKITLKNHDYSSFVVIIFFLNILTTYLA